MDDVIELQAKLCVLATELAATVDTYPTPETWRMRFRNPPTHEEILKAKAELDEAFNQWLTRT